MKDRYVRRVSATRWAVVEDGYALTPFHPTLEAAKHRCINLNTEEQLDQIVAEEQEILDRQRDLEEQQQGITAALANDQFVWGL
jgi:hypothetical protein